MEIYSDAILAGSQSAVGPIAKVPTETMLGGSLEDGTPSYFLNGRLDEVKIFGRALSAAEIRSIYLSGAGGHCRPGPPAVTVVQPSRDAVNVPINQRISATFDMAMDPSTINSGSFQLNNGVTGDVTYDPATRTAILIPFAELTPSTLYTAKITTGAKNLLGAGPASDYVWSFVTGAVPDTTPPVVISTSPLPGTADVATTSSITATFSEPMTASMINQTTFSLLRPNNTEVTGTVVYDPTTVTVRFTPDQPLDQDAVYTAVLGAGIEDAMGNPMTSSYEWTFSTGRPFTTSASIANPMGAGSITIRTSAGEIGEASGSDAASHAGMPLGLRFPYGLVGFQIAGLNPGDTTTITITFPENLSTDAAWFWVDPDLADWIDITGHVRWSGTTASWEITDGDVGDSDGIADGIITDPVGPALDSSQASPGPPTQSGNSGRNCFIATAAYGSYLDAHVRVLREFRDRYLLTNGLGRRFVECYYRSSPPLAELIRRHIVLKTATRWTLTPLVFMIEFPKTGLLVIVAGLMVWRKVRQKGTGRGWITSRNSSSS